MNIQEYISTGILESYVLGLTTDIENREVESYALQYPEIKAEIAAIEASLGRLAGTVEQSPPADLKEKTFARISALAKAEKQSMNGKVIKMTGHKRERESHFSWWVAASVTLLLISSGMNVLLYNRWKWAEDELTSLANEKEVMAQQFNIERTRNEQAATDMAILKRPENKVIMLKGSKMAPEALAVVYWNPSTHDVYLNVETLPDSPPEMQYQLWAIVDGKPVDAGMLDLEDKSGMLHKMKSFDNAQAFAITLEKKGGSPVPNLNALYVMGNV